MKQVLYFSAKWCTACQATTPIIESLKSSKKTQVIMSVKRNKNRTILENGNEINRIVGSMGSDQLNQLING